MIKKTKKKAVKQLTQAQLIALHREHVKVNFLKSIEEVENATRKLRDKLDLLRVWGEQMEVK